jgi:ketosteroid isomerase-like protein
MNESERQTVASTVEVAMRSFEAAERELDAEALIAHFGEIPGFHVYNDGQRLAYEAMVGNIRAGFPKLRAASGGFQNIQVIVLSRDAALATAAFREAVTDRKGVTTTVRGGASWLWRCMDGEWRTAYGQVDHHPDPAG